MRANGPARPTTVKGKSPIYDGMGHGYPPGPRHLGLCPSPFGIDPRATAERSSPHGTINVARNAGMPMADKPHVLAVDDEMDVLLIVKTALKDEYDVATAANGTEALERVAERKPDLIILDMMMPGMDGFAVLDKLKENPENAGIPVIFLTGISDKAKIREALSKGVPYYIVKPFECQDLMAKVQLALKDDETTLL